MKIRRDQQLPIIFILSMLGLLVAIIVYLTRLPPYQPPLECYEETVATMTIQQVSDLFDTALVELTWLPDNLQVSPQISAQPSIYIGHPDLSECVIVIKYPHPSLSSAPNLVSIQSDSFGLQPTKIPASCSWNFTTTGPTGSNCRLELDGTFTTVRLSMSISPEFSPETILQILDGIVVIEPQS